MYASTEDCFFFRVIYVIFFVLGNLKLKFLMYGFTK